MGVLKARVDGAWVEVGGAPSDALWVGPDAPTDPTIEMWADTDAVAPAPASPYTPLDQSSWAWVNQGAATVVQGNGAVVLEGPGSATMNIRARVTAAPAPPYTITAYCVMDIVQLQQNFMGLVWRESSTGKLHTFLIDAITTATIAHYSFTNETTFAASLGARAMVLRAGMRLWLQLQDTGTNLITRYSWTGIAGTFRQITSVLRTAHMAGGPNQVGICVGASVNASAGPQTMTVLSWVIS